MKCPYCDERISAEAKICPRCRGAVVLVKELQEKLRALETEVARLRADPSGQPAAIARMASDGAEVRSPYVAVLVSLLFAVQPALLYQFLPRDEVMWYASVALALVPLCQGFWTGARRPTHTMLEATAFGAAATLVASALVIAVDRGRGIALTPQDYSGLLLVTLAGTGVAFIGAMVAVRRRRSGPGAGMSLVERFVRTSTRVNEDIEPFLKLMDNLARVGGAIAPFATSVLGFLAARLLKS